MIRFVGIIVALLVAILVYQDAKSREMNAMIWAIMVFLFLIIALPIYFIVRKPKVL
jgi:uncharacterized protein YacL